MLSAVIICLLSVLIQDSSAFGNTRPWGKTGYGPTLQDWGFVTVRPGAHMFWWLHYTKANAFDPTSTPLIIYLDGGPGGSSTSHYFSVIEPPTEYAWIKKFNVLLVDNPVGTGFSYTDGDDPSLLTTNNRMIAEDFLVLMQNFYTQLPQFQSTPLYIFSVSYGGKMATEIALVLHEAIEKGTLVSNFKGIGLGDAWISPVDLVFSWNPYLLNLGLVDQRGYKELQEGAKAVAKAVLEGKYAEATNLWNEQQSNVLNITSSVSFYNVLDKTEAYNQYQRTVGKLWQPTREFGSSGSVELMNSEVRQALGIYRTWIDFSDAVFDALSADFMKPVTDIVEKLLNETDLEVVVYNGQLDLIVDTPGTIKWVDELKWTGAEEWKNKDRSPIVVNGFVEGFYKFVGRLTFYWVSRAGHSVPDDNPMAMDFILEKTTTNHGSSWFNTNQENDFKIESGLFV